LYLFAAALISFYFLFNTNSSGYNSMFDLAMIFNFLFSLTIFMFTNKDKIKKNKFMYDVTLMLLMLFSIIYFVNFSYNQIACLFSSSCELEYKNVFSIIYPVFLFLILLYSFTDIFNKTNKTNDILAITVSTLIILIHLRYYFDSKFIHNIVVDEYYTQYSYHYVAQNYIYFAVMYLIFLLRHRVNRENEIYLYNYKITYYVIKGGICNISILRRVFI